MNIRRVLLLTRDQELKNLLSASLIDGGAVVFCARNFDEALPIVYNHGRELDFAVIDCDGECQGRALLSTLNTCYPDLPIIAAVTGARGKVRGLAAGNNSICCLTKPLNAVNFRGILQNLAHPRQMAAA